MTVRRQIVLAACIGFLVPIFWAVAGLILFHARESAFTNLFWVLVQITCPFWNFFGGIGKLAMPLINSALYAIVWMGISNMKRSGAK